VRDEQGEMEKEGNRHARRRRGRDSRGGLEREWSKKESGPKKREGRRRKRGSASTKGRQGKGKRKSRKDETTTTAKTETGAGGSSAKERAETRRGEVPGLAGNGLPGVRKLAKTAIQAREAQEDLRGKSQGMEAGERTGDKASNAGLAVKPAQQQTKEDSGEKKPGGNLGGQKAAGEAGEPTGPHGRREAKTRRPRWLGRAGGLEGAERTFRRGQAERCKGRGCGEAEGGGAGEERQGSKKGRE